MKKTRGIRFLVGCVAAVALLVFGHPARAGMLDIELYGIQGFPGPVIEGSAVEDLVNAPSYPDGPDLTDTIAPDKSPFFEFPQPFAEVNSIDNYGARVRGFLEAPETGEYRFFVRSDDASQFWLSTDHTAGNLRSEAIAEEPESGNDFVDDGIRSSDSIELEKGQQYYFELLFKEATGEDWFQVGWERPDGTLQRPMPLTFVQRYVESGTTFRITRSPQSQEVDEATEVTLSVSVDAPPPVEYQWFKDGSPISGETGSSYSFTASLEDEGDYRVEVTSGGETRESNVATIDVLEDETPPVADSAITKGNPAAITVSYSEAVDVDTAANADNYALDNDATVNSAQIGSSPNVVILETSMLEPGTAYTLTISDVTDRASIANPIAPNPTELLVLQSQGVITSQVYRDITGFSLEDLKGAGKFPDNPDSVEYLNSLELPGNVDSNYGAIIQGYVIAPTTGDYTFYLSAGSAGALYLSEDGEPANKELIAEDAPLQDGVRPERQWIREDGADNVSDPISLEAGQRAYIEAQMKAGAILGLVSQDRLAVTWQRPGEEPPENGDEPIQGGFLSAFTTTGPVTIAEQPTSQEVTELEPVSFTVEVDGTPPYNYLWSKNGEEIPTATDATYTIPEVPLSDDGATVQVTADNAFSDATSDEVSLTVNPDETAPSIQSVSARNIATVATVIFDEKVTEASAQNTDNYSIDQGVTVDEADLQFDGRSVVLTTSPLEDGVTYTLTVNNIQDRADAGNTIAADTQTEFTFVGTERVTDGLLALYTFGSGSGEVVKDTSSVGAPLDLVVDNPDNVSWIPGGGLSVNEETKIVSSEPATKVNAATKNSGALTVEVWTKSLDMDQDGPARIVSVSEGPGDGDRNFQLAQGRWGQDAPASRRWTLRLSENSSGGAAWHTPEESVKQDTVQHVVATVDTSAESENSKIYVDGEVQATDNTTGDFSDFELDRELALANENALVGSGRRYLGEYYLVAIYDRALSESEVVKNYEVGPGTEAEERLPAVAITEPAMDASFSAPARITLTADASDPDGTVAQVDFFAGGELIGTATESPYSITWSDVPAGFKTLSAEVTDNDGNTETSEAIQIVIRPGELGDYASEVAEDGPVAHWRFEETSGDTAADETGTHEASLVNGPELDVEGAIGSAMRVSSGDQSYAEAADNDELDITGSLTIEFWMNIEDGWSSDWAGIVGKGDDTYQIRRSGGSNNLRFDVRGGDAGEVAVTSSSSVSQNEWVHVVAVYDTDAEQMRLYLNGRQDANTASRAGSFAMNDHGLQIGNNFSGSEYRRYLDAKLDEVAIYDQALGEERILAHYFAGQEPVTPGPTPELDISLSESVVIISWEGDASLESASEVTGPWESEDQASPATFEVDDRAMFFRLVQ